jgi:predicted GIY-YIG superfamily endonuclease
MNNFHHVYILNPVSQPARIHTGRTTNLIQRLAEHNAGKVPHTSNFTPWEIRTATAFQVGDRAVAFEGCLKSGSGRAFLHRHL